MKKFVALVLTFVVCMCCIGLIGCSSKVNGTYKFKSMSGEVGGVKIDLEVGEEFMGMITLTEDFMTVEFKDDGTFVLTASEETQSGEWVQEGNQLKVKSNGEEEVWTIEGKTILLESEGFKVILSK